VGDIGAQAVVNTMLSKAFPDDPIVGEEDASDLRLDTDKARSLRERVVQLANDALSPPPTSEELTTGQNVGGWGLGAARTEAELLDTIDKGTYAGGEKGRKSRSLSCLFPYSLMYLIQGCGRSTQLTAPRAS
jgi:3'(2'), 5'-bisphosphate nucleotidase